MNVDSGTLSKSGTGNETYLMNQSFTPSVIMFFVSGKSSDTENHIAIGYWHTGGLDGTLQVSNGKSSQTRAKTLSHFESTTEKVAFTCTGVASGQFTLNHTAGDANYLIHWLAMA